MGACDIVCVVFVFSFCTVDANSNVFITGDEETDLLTDVPLTAATTILTREKLFS